MAVSAGFTAPVEQMIPSGMAVYAQICGGPSPGPTPAPATASPWPPTSAAPANSTRAEREAAQGGALPILGADGSQPPSEAKDQADGVAWYPGCEHMPQRRGSPGWPVLAGLC